MTIKPQAVRPQVGTMTLMFMDVAGYSELAQAHSWKFGTELLDKVGRILRDHNAEVMNTWGDAVFAAFTSSADAARAALTTRDLFNRHPWAAEGYPRSLQARISLHVGEVSIGIDPVTGQRNAIGHPVTIAARVEPMVPPGHVWITPPTRALLVSNPTFFGPNVEVDDCGIHALPKGAGTFELHVLRWTGDKCQHVPPKSRFLIDFVDQEESDIVHASNPEVSYGRAYRLLLHIFREQLFTRFCALDLAFQRWEELVNDDENQTVNVSREVFEALQRAVDAKRKLEFRRIMVIARDRLTQPLCRDVLKVIKDRECRWIGNTGVTIETRVLPDPTDRADVQRIAALQDFAQFEGDKGHCLAIVEPSLRSVSCRTDPRTSKCRLDTDQGRATERFREFDSFWAKARGIADTLGLR